MLEMMNSFLGPSKGYDFMREMKSQWMTKIGLA